MPVPDFQTLMRPLLEEYAGGNERPIAEVRAALAAQFGLTPEELAERLPSGLAKTFDNRVGWAATYLDRVGLLEHRLHFESFLSRTELQLGSIEVDRRDRSSGRRRTYPEAPRAALQSAARAPRRFAAQRKRRSSRSVCMIFATRSSRTPSSSRPWPRSARSLATRTRRSRSPSTRGWRATVARRRRRSSSRAASDRDRLG